MRKPKAQRQEPAREGQPPDLGQLGVPGEGVQQQSNQGDDGGNPRDEEHAPSMRFVAGGTMVYERELWILVLGYVRYAMGRMSTAPSMAADFVRQWRGFFTPEHVDQIRREVAQELASYESCGKKLGMDCDHETWRRLVDDLGEPPPDKEGVPRG